MPAHIGSVYGILIDFSGRFRRIYLESKPQPTRLVVRYFFSHHHQLNRDELVPLPKGTRAITKC